MSDVEVMIPALVAARYFKRIIVDSENKFTF